MTRVIMRSGTTYRIEDVERFLGEGVKESETLDYKADPELWPDPSRKPAVRLQAIIAKAVSAFANRGGGTLLLGVDEGKDGLPLRTQTPGMPAQLDGMPIVERVDRMITRCVFPRPRVEVYSVSIDGTDRAYVILDVAARSGGPYRVIETQDPSLDGRYFVRAGRSSLPADHHQLRDLFQAAMEGPMRVREYLAQRGFGDPDGEDFMRRPPSSLLAADEDPSRRGVGAVALTVIPRVLRGDALETDAIDMESDAVRRVLDQSGVMSTFGDRHPTLEGIAIESNTSAPLLLSYLHAHRTGYLEAGHTRAYRVTDHGKYVSADAVQAIAEPLLKLARQFYEAAQIADDVLIGVHVRASDSARLGTYVSGSQITGKGRCVYRNLTIDVVAPANELGSDGLLARLDRRLAHAFGVEDGLVRNPDGSRRPPMLWG